jgi:hypothetical protein
MSEQIPLFGGRTFDPARDGERLSASLIRVRACVSDGRWHTLEELARKTGDPEASISARLRDLRKAKFGGRQVERRYVADGLWEYRLVPQGAGDGMAT